MHCTTKVLPAALVLLALSGVDRTADEMPFRPRKDTDLSRTYTAEMTWTLEDMEMYLDDSPVEEELPEAGGTHRMTLEVRDELLGVTDATITKLRRTFGEISSASSFRVDPGTGEVGDYGVECASALVDKPVVFTWDEDAEDYALAFDEEAKGGDTDLLEGLEFDMDFRAFLPDGVVEEGDDWDLDAALLRLLFAPGGDVHPVPESWVGGSLFTVPTATIVASSLANLYECSAGETKGDVKATYDGTTEVEGDVLATIRIDVDATLVHDKTARFQAFGAKVMGDEGNDELTLEDEVDIEGRGVLLWDVKAGRFHSFGFEGEITLIAKLAWSDTTFVVDGEPMHFHGTYEVAGGIAITAACAEE